MDGRPSSGRAPNREGAGREWEPVGAGRGEGDVAPEEAGGGGEDGSGAALGHHCGLPIPRPSPAPVQAAELAAQVLQRESKALRSRIDAMEKEVLQKVMRCAPLPADLCRWMTPGAQPPQRPAPHPLPLPGPEFPGPTGGGWPGHRGHEGPQRDCGAEGCACRGEGEGPPGRDARQQGPSPCLSPRHMGSVWLGRGGRGVRL